MIHIGQLIRWSRPDTEFGYTHTRVYRSLDSGSTFSELTASDAAAYTATGIVIATTYVHDINGVPGAVYKIRFYNSSTTNYSAYSDNMTADDFRGYCTVEDVREFSNNESTEMSDGAIQNIIDEVTAEIDFKTNRTWQGIQTVTNEYSDCDGGCEVYLPHGDIQTVTAFSVDDDHDGTYTSVTPSKILIYSERGSVFLDSRDGTIEVRQFPRDGHQLVKASYTYGNSDPTSLVKYLAILMVLNQIYMDAIRYNKIQSLIRQLSRKVFKQT